MERPDPAELPDVVGDARVVRVFSHRDCDARATGGARLLPQALSWGQFQPNPKSYGPSFFVASDLRDGVRRLEQAMPAWADYGVIEFSPRDLMAVFPWLRVVYTPMDCQFEASDVRATHATVLGVRNRLERLGLLRFLGERIVRLPRA